MMWLFTIYNILQKRKLIQTNKQRAIYVIVLALVLSKQSLHIDD